MHRRPRMIWAILSLCFATLRSFFFMKGGDLPKCKVNSKVLKYNKIHPNHLIFLLKKPIDT